MIESLPKGLYVDLYQAEASALFGGPQVHNLTLTSDMQETID